MVDYNRFMCEDSTRSQLNTYFLGDVFAPKTIEFTEADVKVSIDLEVKSAFLEGVAKYLCALGINCSADDKKLISAEIKRRYRERTQEATPKAIQNWANGSNTPDVEKDKENHYMLCYALGMDINETAIFFAKHFFLLPFNYKYTTDAIFYYCLMRQRPYSTIKEMLEIANQKKETLTDRTREGNPEHTTEVQRWIDDIDNDDDFKQFLSNCCYSDAQQYQRAKEAITQLIDGSGNEYSKLHEELMGFNYQNQKHLKDAKSKFLPKEFTRSLPTPGTFSAIKSGTIKSYETLRKTFIILLFYDWYIGYRNNCIELSKSKIKQNLYDFYADTNQKLLECGLVPLYIKNLFDQVILFCANSPSPLDTFYGINDLRYIEE